MDATKSNKTNQDRVEAERIAVAKWLNTKGYDLELSNDGLWMKEYPFQECRTKELLDHMIDFSKVKIRELLFVQLEKGTIDSELFNFYLFHFTK